ncbi:MAG: hypothetical protein M3044_03400 [Thermoproteota archaeon]|nr:hypothetical protein [Thermoproteota archaeon]
MSKHGKLVNVLMKLHFIEDSQRSIKEIRQQIERYEMRNLELVSKWPNGMPEWARNEKYNIDTKISELKWTIYDD